ncbi:hypothetical protein QUF58_07045 [Anaerolineales bacterium HSG24]|nr:hypothetical protein [Anaerolineales bacterium HSG24]
MSKSKRASRQTLTAKTAAKPTISPILILGIVAILVTFIGAALIFWDSGVPQSTGVRIAIDDTEFPSKGNPDALVTMVEFSDYG